MIRKLVLITAGLLHFSIPTAALAYGDKLTYLDQKLICYLKVSIKRRRRSK